MTTLSEVLLGYQPAWCRLCFIQIFTGLAAQFGAAPFPDLCPYCAKAYDHEL